MCSQLYATKDTWICAMFPVSSVVAAMVTVEMLATTSVWPSPVAKTRHL